MARWIEVLYEPEGFDEPERPCLPTNPDEGLARTISPTHARILAAADAEFRGFFGLRQPPVLVTDALTGVDDWEGPLQPEYRERDDEAFDEMCLQDMHGYS